MKNSGGRPTMYRPEFCALAENYCLLGASNSELADFFGVSTSTLEKWINRRAEFRAAMRSGRELADAKVARSLFKRACGYTQRRTHVTAYHGQVTLTEVDEPVAPDTAAALAWLQSRAPAKWRRNINADDGMTLEEIAREAQKAIAAAMATIPDST